MANSRNDSSYQKYATVDTLPESTGEGYYTNEINLRELQKDFKVQKAFFSIREYGDDDSMDVSDIVVTLQFKCADDERWQDYRNEGTAFATGDRVAIEDTGKAIRWRAGVKEDDYTSGAVTFGFDW